MTRPISGIVLLDKAQGVTSNRALQIVKRLYQAEKAGHTGSLDPLATGMLPICLGQATKLSRYLLAAHKRYRVVARLGVATETGDADGAVVATAPIPTLTAGAVVAALEGFRGDIQQVPPMYSALKYRGERLYKLARRGEHVERPRRSVHISAIDLELFDTTDIAFTITCSKGTYVRSLVEDLGVGLGTLAHVVGLRRLAVEPFLDEAMHTLASLQERAERGPSALEECLLPVDSGIAHWPRLDLQEGTCSRLAQGQRVPSEPDWPESRVRVYGAERGFLGIAEIEAGELIPRRLFPDLGGSR